MANLKFDLSHLPSLLDAARGGDTPIIDFGYEESGLLLVSNKAGVYLLANAQIPDDSDGPLLLLHARGMNPARDADWEQARDEALGSQDMVEFIPVSAFDEVVEAGFEELVVDLTDDEVLVYGHSPD